MWNREPLVSYLYDWSAGGYWCLNELHTHNLHTVCVCKFTCVCLHTHMCAHMCVYVKICGYEVKFLWRLLWFVERIHPNKSTYQSSCDWPISFMDFYSANHKYWSLDWIELGIFWFNVIVIYIRLFLCFVLFQFLIILISTCISCSYYAYCVYAPIGLANKP